MKVLVIISAVVAGLVGNAVYSDETATATATEAKHLDLDTTTIRSSSELPSLMAVVPWKKALPANLGGRPDKSLIESLLKPLDPDVFRLQLDFYKQLFVTKESAPDGGDKIKTGEK